MGGARAASVGFGRQGAVSPADPSGGLAPFVGVLMPRCTFARGSPTRGRGRRAGAHGPASRRGALRRSHSEPLRPPRPRLLRGPSRLRPRPRPLQTAGSTCSAHHSSCSQYPAARAARMNSGPFRRRTMGRSTPISSSSPTSAEAGDDVPAGRGPRRDGRRRSPRTRRPGGSVGGWLAYTSERGFPDRTSGPKEQRRNRNACAWRASRVSPPAARPASAGAGTGSLIPVRPRFRYGRTGSGSPRPRGAFGLPSRGLAGCLPGRVRSPGSLGRRS